MKISEDHPIWQAIDIGGGQTCDIRGVLRALYLAGYTITPRGSSDDHVLAAEDDEASASKWIEAKHF